MSERFRLEIAYSLDRVGVRVIAKPSGWTGPRADIRITGNLSPDAAIAFAEELRAKAEQVKARNAKKDAAERRRDERMSKLPTIGWR
jgi:hypothetical protein